VAAAARVDAEVAAAELAAAREVASAHAHYLAAAEAVAALEGLVLDTLGESLDLLRRAVEAGELSATDVLLLRRELIDGQREQIEAASELWLAGKDLELAVEGDPVGTGTAAMGEETTDAD
jgi:outer membrane protein TolC